MIVLALAIAGAMWMKRVPARQRVGRIPISRNGTAYETVESVWPPENVPEYSLNRDRTASREYKSDVCLKHRFPNVGPERRYSVRHGDGVP